MSDGMSGGIPGGMSADTVAYPRSRFTPYDSIAHICYADMSDTYSIHLFNSGWLSDERIRRRALQRANECGACFSLRADVPGCLICKGARRL